MQTIRDAAGAVSVAATTFVGRISASETTKGSIRQRVAQRFPLSWNSNDPVMVSAPQLVAFFNAKPKLSNSALYNQVMSPLWIIRVYDVDRRLRGPGAKAPMFIMLFSVVFRRSISIIRII